MRLLWVVVPTLGWVGAAVSAPGMAAASEFRAPVVPRPDLVQYVVARDAHLYVGTRRVRLWGYNIQAGAFATYAEITAVVGRLSRLGVNAVRLWPTAGAFYEADSVQRRAFAGAVMRDGSALDRYDFFVAELKRNGIFVQNPALHYIDVETIRRWPDPQVRSILGARADESQIREWHGIAPYLSSNWEEMLATHIRNYLSHLNPYTGRTYADEPLFAGWELANESRFVHCMLRGACVTGLPKPLRDLLERHWKTYWRVMGGKGHVAIPVFDATWDRSDSSVHATYRRFVYDRFVTVSRRLEEVARNVAPRGKGVAVQPFVYSTQAGDPLLVARAAHAAGDVSAIGAYQTPLDPNAGNPFWPYRVNLGLPVFYNFNYGAVAGKPTVVYENSFFRPYPYRVEWPWAMLYLAATQDWDGVFLYSYGQPWAIYSTGAEEITYGTKALPVPDEHDPSAGRGVYVGLHHGGDEVVVASWAAAGLAFLTGELQGREDKKVTYEFGEPAMFGPAPGYCTGPKGCMPGARQAMAEMNMASLARPIRLAGIETKDDGGRRPRNTMAGVAAHGPMTLDRNVPRLVVDTPHTKAVAGMLDGTVRFDGGYVLRFPRKQFGFVALMSVDGVALARRSVARVLMGGKSANSGFMFDGTRVAFGNPVGVVHGVIDAGHRPIVFERVQFELTLPEKASLLTRHDFNFVAYRSDTGSQVLAVDGMEPTFAIEIVQ